MVEQIDEIPICSKCGTPMIFRPFLHKEGEDRHWYCFKCGEIWSQEHEGNRLAAEAMVKKEESLDWRNRRKGAYKGGLSDGEKDGL